MRQYIIIREEENGEKEVWATSTRKRDIESRFNKMMRSFKKESNRFVEELSLGHAMVTCYGEWHTFRVEWYITARNI